jgi:hypothetical protein
MAGGVAQLVQSGRVVVRGILEIFALGQVDLIVSAAAIKGAAVSVMVDGDIRPS